MDIALWPKSIYPISFKYSNDPQLLVISTFSISSQSVSSGMDGGNVDKAVLEQLFTLTLESKL